MLTLDSDPTGDTDGAGKRRRRIRAPAIGSRTADLSAGYARIERIEQVELAALRGYDRNARVHSPKQVTQLAASIREFGFVNPIIADVSNVVVAGHGRLAAARELSLATVPVIRLEHLTPEQIRAYRIADNRLAELAPWDEELLALELQDLVGLELEFNLELAGFATEEIDELIAGLDDDGDEVEDEPPTPAERAVSRLGDLWQLGAHRIHCADARDPAAYGRLLGRDRVQLALSDPPYNVNIKKLYWRGKTKYLNFDIAAGELSRE